MKLPLSNWNGSAVIQENRDFALVDATTGGIILPDSYSIDYTLGVITFIDADGATPGLQAHIIYPNSAVRDVIDLAGRTVRALYEVNNEWSIQPTKAASFYTPSYVAPLAGQFYVGGSSASPGGSARRIYFPAMDVGQRISFATIWYRSSADALLHQMQDVDFVVRNSPADPIGLPYIDLAENDANATGVDATVYGYAVRGVKGASIKVRVLYNISSFALTDQTDKNGQALDRFRGQYHQSITESFIQGGGQ